jgi:hypothetical protein
MICFTAKACGKWLPLLSITLQGCTSFRHLSLHSVHCQPPASATHARVLPFIPFRSGQPAVSFRSPLAFLSHDPELKAKTGSYIPPTQIRYIAFSHHPCFSPCQPAVCPAVEFAPEPQKPQKPHQPLMVQVKIKSICAWLCACSRFVSLIQSFALTLVPRVAAL